MDVEHLRDIGLTQGEVKVYRTLIEHGELTRTELAQESGISSSKVYDVANRLARKGIITLTKRNKVIHFSAAHPEHLTEFLDKKEEELKRERKLVEQMLPSLIMNYQAHREDTNVEVFYGWEGMKSAFDDLARALGKGDFNYIFGASQGMNTTMADVFFVQHDRDRLRKGFATKIIFNEEVRVNKHRTAPFSRPPNEMRFLHQETFAEVNLYKDTVLLILLLGDPIVIRITNKDAARSFKKFFDTLWEEASP